MILAAVTFFNELPLIAFNVSDNLFVQLFGVMFSINEYMLF